MVEFVKEPAPLGEVASFDYEPPKPAVGPELSELYALQYAIAENSMREDTRRINQYRVSQGQERMMRQELQAKLGSSNDIAKQNAFNRALEDGSVDTAEAILRLERPTPEALVTETAVIEETAAARMADPDQAVYEVDKPQDEEAQKRSDEARALALSNALVSVMDKAVPFDIQTTAGMSEPEIIARTILQKSYAGFSMGKDLLRLMIPFLYPLERQIAGGNVSTNPLVTLALPGNEASAEADYLMSGTDEEFAERLDKLVEVYTERFDGAPIVAFAALFDSIFTGQKDNPQMRRILAMTELYGGPNPAAEIGQMETSAGPIYNLFYRLFSGNRTTDTRPTVGGVFSDPFVQNAFNMFDVASAISSLPAAKRALQVMYGNKAIAAATAESSLQAAGQAKNVNVDELRHLVSLTTTDPHIIPEVRTMLDNALIKAEEGVFSLTEPVRIGFGGENAAAVTKALEQASTGNYGKRLVNTSPEKAGSDWLWNVFIGNKKGAAYASQKNAEKAASAFGADVPVSVVPNPSGSGFLIKIQHSVDEQGWYTGTENLQPVATMGKGIWGKAKDTSAAKYLFSPAVTSIKRSIERGTASAMNRAVLASTLDDILKPVTKLNTKQSKHLATIINEGKMRPNPTPDFPENTGKWFSYNELDAAYTTMRGTGVTPVEAQAYYSYKFASDFSFQLMNDAERSRLLSVGAETWNLKNSPLKSIIGTKVDGASSLSDNSRVLLQDGSIINKATAESVMASGKMRLIRTDGAVEHAGQELTHVLVKEEDAFSAGLQRRILGYTEGGTRNYQGTHFVKSQRKGSFDGKEYYKNPYVHGVFETRSAALKYEKEMKALAAEYKLYQKDALALHAGKPPKHLSVPTLTSLKAHYSNRFGNIRANTTLDDVEDMIARGWDINEEVRVLFDREAFPANGGPQLEHLQTYQSGGRMYYGQRGEHLMADDAPAPLINPFTALSNQMSRMVQASTYSDFMIREIGEWTAAFGSNYKLSSTNHVIFPSGKDLIMDGVWKGGEGPDVAALRNTAEAQRFYIRRMLAMPGTSDVAIMQSKARFAQKLSAMWGDKLGDTAFGDAVRSGRLITDAHVVASMRGVMYNLALGFFNVGQLALQGSAAISAIILHPVHGMQAALDYPVIRMMMTLKNNPKVAAYLDKALTKQGLMVPGGVASVMDDYMRSGLHLIAKTDSLRDFSDVEGVTRSKFVSHMGEAMRMPLYEGERVGRIVAFGIARREAMDLVAQGKLVDKSEEYLEYIRAGTNKYTMNMMSGMETWWQKNTIAAIPTQFWQYPVKYAEVFLGANKQFTAAERARFIAGHTLMWGAFAIPGGPDIMEVGSKVTDLNEETYNTILYGMGTDVLNNLVGGDEAAWGMTFGSGDFLGGVVRDMFTDGTPISAAGGVSFDVAKKVRDISKSAWRGLGRPIFDAIFSDGVLRAEDLVVPTKEVLIDVGHLARSMSNYTKSYYLWKYDDLLDTKGNIVDRNSDFSEMVASMGFKSIDETKAWNISEDNMKKRERLNEISREIARLQYLAGNAFGEKDDKKAKQYYESASRLMLPLSPQEKIDVLRAVSSLHFRDVGKYEMQNIDNLRYNPKGESE